MAACDYKLCDVCGNKAYYDSEVIYHDGVIVKALCTECSQTHEIVIKKTALMDDNPPDTMPEEMPGELERLICNYTRNDRNAINRFLGASKACGYQLVRADLTPSTPEKADIAKAIEETLAYFDAGHFHNLLQKEIDTWPLDKNAGGLTVGQLRNLKAMLVVK